MDGHVKTGAAAALAATALASLALAAAPAADAARRIPTQLWHTARLDFSGTYAEDAEARDDLGLRLVETKRDAVSWTMESIHGFLVRREGRRLRFNTTMNGRITSYFQRYEEQHRGCSTKVVTSRLDRGLQRLTGFLSVDARSTDFFAAAPPQPTVTEEDTGRRCDTGAERPRTVRQRCCGTGLGAPGQPIMGTQPKLGLSAERQIERRRFLNLTVKVSRFGRVVQGVRTYRDTYAPQLSPNTTVRKRMTHTWRLVLKPCPGAGRRPC